MYVCSSSLVLTLTSLLAGLARRTSGEEGEVEGHKDLVDLEMCLQDKHKTLLCENCNNNAELNGSELLALAQVAAQALGLYQDPNERLLTCM